MGELPTQPPQADTPLWDSILKTGSLEDWGRELEVLTKGVPHSPPIHNARRHTYSGQLSECHGLRGSPRPRRQVCARGHRYVPPPPPTPSCPKGSHGGSKREKRSPLHRRAELPTNLHIQPSKRQREATQLPQSIS